MRRTEMTGLALLALAVSAAGHARPRAGIAYTLKDLGTLGLAPSGRKPELLATPRITWKSSEIPWF
jgi:hypothetical protein